MHNCAGEPIPVADRAYTAPAVLASNMLIGSRAQANCWDYMRHALAMSKKSAATDVTNLVANCGRILAPFVDTRSDTRAHKSPGAWHLSSIPYVRADGREFRCRLWRCAALRETWQLRALMHAATLNMLLSLYAGAAGARCCLVVCTQI